MGWGRSGSTLLSKILGSYPGVTAIGESRYLMQKAVLDGRPCSCNETIETCDLWGGVFRRAHEYFGTEAAAEIARLVDSATTTKNAFRYLVGAKPPEKLVAVYRSVLGGLMEGTGAGALVEASKFPAFGLLLENAFPGQVYFLHLVRNPMATAYSWMSSKAEPDRGAGARLHRIGALENGVRWTYWNAVSSAIGQRYRSRYRQLRYEDLTANPKKAVEGVLDWFGHSIDSGPFVDYRTVRVSESHILAGNPNRFDQGNVFVKNDDRWESDLDSVSGLITRLTTWPVAALCGY